MYDLLQVYLARQYFQAYETQPPISNIHVSNCPGGWMHLIHVKFNCCERS